MVNTLYRAQRKKGLRRGDERRVRARPLLPPDLGAPCEVNLGHAADIPRDSHSVKMTDPSNLGGPAGDRLGDRNAQRLTVSYPEFMKGDHTAAVVWDRTCLTR